jgi:hypothetical protein
MAFVAGHHNNYPTTGLIDLGLPLWATILIGSTFFIVIICCLIWTIFGDCLFHYYRDVCDVYYNKNRDHKIQYTNIV